MEIIKSEYELCPSCMEIHKIYTVRVWEDNIFKGLPVKYRASYKYCECSGDFWADESMITTNDIALKRAYNVNRVSCILVCAALSERE